MLMWIMMDQFSGRDQEGMQCGWVVRYSSRTINNMSEMGRCRKIINSRPAGEEELEYVSTNLCYGY